MNTPYTITFLDTPLACTVSHNPDTGALEGVEIQVPARDKKTPIAPPIVIGGEGAAPWQISHDEGVNIWALVTQIGSDNARVEARIDAGTGELIKLCIN